MIQNTLVVRRIPHSKRRTGVNTKLQLMLLAPFRNILWTIVFLFQDHTGVEWDSHSMPCSPISKCEQPVTVWRNSENAADAKPSDPSILFFCPLHVRFEALYPRAVFVDRVAFILDSYELNHFDPFFGKYNSGNFGNVLVDSLRPFGILSPLVSAKSF